MQVFRTTRTVLARFRRSPNLQVSICQFVTGRCACCGVRPAKKETQIQQIQQIPQIKKALAYAVRSVGGYFCMRVGVVFFQYTPFEYKTQM
jgi:hypothetical protein